MVSRRRHPTSGTSASIIGPERPDRLVDCAELRCSHQHHYWRGRRFHTYSQLASLTWWLIVVVYFIFGYSVLVVVCSWSAGGGRVSAERSTLDRLLSELLDHSIRYLRRFLFFILPSFRLAPWAHHQISWSSNAEVIQAHLKFTIIFSFYINIVRSEKSSYSGIERQILYHVK